MPRKIGSTCDKDTDFDENERAVVARYVSGLPLFGYLRTVGD